MDKKFEKITISKRDEAAEVVEKIIDSEAGDIVLSIPRFSKLTDSLANFHLIKREADMLRKKVVVESVDDKAIELASLAKLESVNPFFVKSRRQISDITHNQPVSKQVTPALKAKEVVRARQRNKIHLPKLPTRRRVMVVVLAVVVLILGLIIATKVLPHAEINLVRKKTPWTFNAALTVSKSEAEVDFIHGRLPGEIFSQSKNMTLSFPASGRKKVEQYAGGKMLVYNAYSSEPQPLVARTRFVAPDGKVFRLKQNIVVPGAKIVDGQIVSSSIETDVVADQAGAEYNIGPASRFTIPGFKGSPKYNAFYGESKEPMAGGFVGEAGYPSGDDLKTAKAELRDKLNSAVTAAVLAQVPKEFKVLDGVRQINYTDPRISPDLDQSGNFSIYGEVAMKVMAFREGDILKTFLGKMRSALGDDMEFKDYSLSYGQPRVDFTKGIMDLPIKFDGVAAKHIDQNDLIQKLLNKSEADIKAVLLSWPGLESARVSLKPLWVRHVPSNPAKINLIVD